MHFVSHQLPYVSVLENLHKAFSKVVYYSFALFAQASQSE